MVANGTTGWGRSSLRLSHQIRLRIKEFCEIRRPKRSHRTQRPEVATPLKDSDSSPMSCKKAKWTHEVFDGLQVRGTWCSIQTSENCHCRKTVAVSHSSEIQWPLYRPTNSMLITKETTLSSPSPQINFCKDFHLKVFLSSWKEHFLRLQEWINW